MFIQTQRLFLRPFQKKDADALYPLFADPQVTRYMRYFDIQTRRDFDDLFKSHFLPAGPMALAILQREDKKLIGFFEFHEGGVMTYALKRSAWGHGYMPEAGKAMLPYAFDQLHFAKIEGQHADANPASGKVLLKMGLRPKGSIGSFTLPSGQLIKIMDYQLTRAQWEKQRITPV